MKQWIIIGVLCLLCLFLPTGCETVTEGGQRGKDLDYTVVPTADIPEDFAKEIDKKKINAFQMTYQDGEYLYIAIGYGQQENSGFSIQIIGLYEKGENICIEASLTGPEDGEIVSEKESFPFIVVKTEQKDKKVEFYI